MGILVVVTVPFLVSVVGNIRNGLEGRGWRDRY